jgi:hypothetical protein
MAQFKNAKKLKNHRQKLKKWEIIFKSRFGLEIYYIFILLF